MAINLRILGVIAVAPLLVGLLAGCTAAGDAAEETGTSGGAAQSFEDWQLDFAACMREAGIDYPDPGEDGGSVTLSEQDADAFGAAADACIEELGEAPVNPDAPTEGESDAETLKMVQCLRDNGIDVDDPKPGEAIGVPDEVSPEVLEECVFSGGTSTESGN